MGLMLRNVVTWSVEELCCSSEIVHWRMKGKTQLPRTTAYIKVSLEAKACFEKEHLSAVAAGF
jgi:hypothetical protein